MKYLFTLLLIICAFNSKADYWTRKADFPGGPRAGAFGFSIGNKGYVGGGVGMNGASLNDFWEYDPIINLWTQKANFPRDRAYAVSFTLNKKGYVCTGARYYVVGIISHMWAYNDLLEYDPSTDSWSDKANFPDQVRSNAVSFVIDSLAYVGTGGGDDVRSHGLYADFHTYNPKSNTWGTITSIPNLESMMGSGFSIFNKGYVTGQYIGYTYGYSHFTSDTLWQYDPQTNTWSAKATFPGTPRCEAIAFTINNLGYFGTGDTTFGGLLSDLWQYNAVTDTWVQKASMPATARDETAYFVVGNRAYVCFGGEARNSELWEYTPDGVGVDSINGMNVSTQVYPNPFSVQTIILFSKGLQNAELRILDVCGKEIATYGNINARYFILNRNNLPSGLYFYKITENGILLANDKFIVQ